MLLRVQFISYKKSTIFWEGLMRGSKKVSQSVTFGVQAADFISTSRPSLLDINFCIWRLHVQVAFERLTLYKQILARDHAFLAALITNNVLFETISMKQMQTFHLGYPVCAFSLFLTALLITGAKYYCSTLKMPFY